MHMCVRIRGGLSFPMRIFFGHTHANRTVARVQLRLRSCMSSLLRPAQSKRPRMTWRMRSQRKISSSPLLSRTLRMQQPLLADERLNLRDAP